MQFQTEAASFMVLRDGNHSSHKQNGTFYMTRALITGTRLLTAVWTATKMFENIVNTD